MATGDCMQYRREVSNIFKKQNREAGSCGGGGGAISNNCLT
jgi:hypothetical protein